MRRWWTGDRPSVRLSEAAAVLVLAGTLAWAGWFASASQGAAWTPVLVALTIVVTAASEKRRRSRMSRTR
jgi:hypothetical protein